MVKGNKITISKSTCILMFIATFTVAKTWEQIVIEKWIDKENVVYTHSELLFNHKQEGNPAILDNVDDPGHWY